MRGLKLALLYLLRCVGVFRLARRLTRNRLTILCYHGFALADEAEFRPKLFITPHRFEQRLETLRRLKCRVLPLDEAVERLYAGTLPPHSVVITVDDGFHSFGQVAAPRLHEHRFPATVYVTTYYVKHANPVFRLAVQYMFWKSNRRRIELSGRSWSPDRCIDMDDPAQRGQAMWACIAHGERSGSEAQRTAICRELGELLECPYEDIVRSRILHLMSPDELRAVSGGGIDVELHTHRHVFPGEDQALARREIEENRRMLEALLPGARRHFCYPSGSWNPRQWRWLEDLAVRSSTTCDPGMNTRDTPRHALRRFLDGENIHELEFEAALCGLPEFLRGLKARSRSPAPSMQVS